MNVPFAPETWLMLATAFGLGALHSFEPSHAKAVMVAYFIAQRRRVADAVALGLIVSLAHTLSVLALALVVRALAAHWSADRIEAPAELVGGLVVLGLGVWMLVQLRLRRELFRPQTHEHEHDCPYPHHAAERGGASLGQLFAVGLACGIVPCPQALMLLPAAVGVGNLTLSLWLVVAFSAGIGVVVIALGVLVCQTADWAERTFERLQRHAAEIRRASAILILVVGAVLCVRALFSLAGI